MAGEVEIARILSASIVRTENIFCFAPTFIYDEQELRKRYRKSALLVHPDKCKSDGAEDAFKILNNAFELLLTRLPNVDNGLRVNEPAAAKENESKTHRSENVPSHDTRDASASSNKGGHQENRGNSKCGWRCQSNRAEDLHGDDVRCGDKRKSSAAVFQDDWARAESEFLSENLKKKIVREAIHRRKMFERDEVAAARTTYLQAECKLQEEHVESRATNWKKWMNIKEEEKTGNRSRDECDADSSKSVGHVSTQAHSLNNTNGDGNANFNIECVSNQNFAGNYHVCVLCQRQFRSIDALLKHEQLSDLHKANALKDAAS